jgi:hypothetical protein
MRVSFYHLLPGLLRYVRIRSIRGIFFIIKPVR